MLYAGGTKLSDWVLVNEAGDMVQVGAQLKTFRDEDVTLTDGRPPREEGSSGRVSIRGPTDGQSREYYPSVCRLKWVLATDSQKLVVEIDKARGEVMEQPTYSNLDTVPLEVLKAIVERREAALVALQKAEATERSAHIKCACGAPATQMAQADLRYTYRRIKRDENGYVRTSFMNGQSSLADYDGCPGEEEEFDALVFLCCDKADCETREWRSISSHEFWRVAN